MFDELFSKVDTQRANKYLDALTKEERELVDAFPAWLQRKHAFKAESAKSYRSNLARAQWKVRDGQDLDGDERSAVRKFREFVGELGEALVAFELV